jgi:hypothetical protein
MKADYTYIVSIADELTQESFVLTVKGEQMLNLVMSRKPERQTVMSVQNIGVTTDAIDYLQNLTDEGDLNFGAH